MNEKLKIKFSLEKIKFYKRGRYSGKTRPFLWTIFFKIDNDTVKITDAFHLNGNAVFKFSESNHGNLPNELIRPGTSLIIPEKFGSWETTLTPFKVPVFESTFPAISGVLTVLLKQGNVSAAGVAAGHQRLNQLVTEAINQSILDFDPKKLDLRHAEQSVRLYLENRVRAFADGIMGSVEKAVRDAQGILQNLWSLTNRDALIGFQVWDFNTSDIERQQGNITFSQRWPHPRFGDWEIFGKLEDMNRNAAGKNNTLEKAG